MKKIIEKTLYIILYALLAFFFFIVVYSISSIYPIELLVVLTSFILGVFFRKIFLQKIAQTKENSLKKICYILLIAFALIFFLLLCPNPLVRTPTAPPRPEFKTVNFLRAKISKLQAELKSQDYFLLKRDKVNFEEEYSFKQNKGSFETKIRETYGIDEDFPIFLFGELMKLQRSKFYFLDYEKRFRILKHLPPVERDFIHNSIDALVINLDDKGNIAFIKLDGNNMIEIEKTFIKGEPLYKYIGLDENGKIIDEALEKQFLERLNLYLIDEETAITLAKKFFSRDIHYKAIDLIDWQIEESSESFSLKGDLPQNYIVKGRTPKVTIKGGDVYIKLKKSNGKILSFKKNYMTNEEF